MEARVRADDHVHVERVDVVAERAFTHTSLDDLLEQRDGRRVLTQDRLGLPEVLGAVDVLDADELDELRWVVWWSYVASASLRSASSGDSSSTWMPRSTRRICA